MPFRRRVPARPHPTVSVVVPVYDVAAYVEDCLTSIARQPVDDHEVIVVDDGSPDRSVEVVERLMRRDGRIRLLRQANAGLGAARNAGVAEATGTYLAFVDSDDVLPPDAWGAMLASLERTGSDLAVGTAERDDGIRRWTTPLMRRNHEVARPGIDVAQQPLILADVFAWNKLYRRSFWSGAGLSFPEGTRYEDQPALTRAFLAASSFDVLTETVYRWAVREDRSSITQKRHETADLVDRLETKRDSARVVRERAGDEVVRVFFAEVLPVDLWEYFRAVPGCDADYWSLLVAGVRELWNDRTLPFEETAVPPQQRLMGWFVAQDRRADLESLLAWIDANRPLPFEGGELAHPWRAEAGLPPLPGGQ
ncbi:MAG: Teichoic acid biosynthesis protein [Marmoricola sp.]|jgi:glycosyltransferase involved in cell wall biosynthesis|nr:Teichoic acid biosynthesis protein [Marmoricola sp.]